MKNSLHAMYVRLDSSFSTLTGTAMAQLVLKLAYSSGKKFSVAEMKHYIRQLLKTNKVERVSVEDAISSLVKSNQLVPDMKGYKLSPKAKAELKIVESTSKQNFASVFQKYFSKAESSSDVVKLWFEDMNIFFFHEFSSSWIKDLYDNSLSVSNNVTGIHKIARKAFRRQKNINPSDKDWLIKNFISYLSCDDTQEHSVKWGYCTSFFSSSLLTTGLSADPLAVNMLQDATIILDTNILIRAKLEGYKLHRSVILLDKIFKHINVDLIYLFITKEEYKNAINAERRFILDAVSKVRIELLNKTNNDFINTGQLRFCRSEEDYNRLFDDLFSLPSHLHENTMINILDNDVTQQAVDNGHSDKSTQNSLNAIYRAKYYKNKKKGSLLHDSALISVCKQLRKNSGKTLILTTDSVLLEYTHQNPIRNTYPLALGIQNLIEILAIDSASIGINPVDCAPLFTDMIRLAIGPADNAFRLEDLTRMYSVSDSINDLNLDTAMDIAVEVSNMRHRNEPEETIALFLQRRFEGERLSAISDIGATKEKLRREVHENELLKIKNRALRDRIIERKEGELRDDINSDIARSKFCYFILYPSIIMIIVYVIAGRISNEWGSDALLAVGVTAAISLFLDKFFWNPKFKRRSREYYEEIHFKAVEFADRIAEHT